MSDTERNLQIFRDNAKNKGNELRKLYEKKNQLASKPDLKEDRLQQDTDKAQKLVEKYQNELVRVRSAFEKVQKEQLDAEDKVTDARNVQQKLQARLQEESRKTHREYERESSKIDNEIRTVEREQRTWETKAMNAERDLQLEYKRIEQAANDNNKTSGSRDGRSTYYRRAA